LLEYNLALYVAQKLNTTSRCIDHKPRGLKTVIPVPSHGKDRFDPYEEPSADALAAIEREWSLIQAEIDLIDVEIKLLTATGGPSEADWRRLRHAIRRVLREAAALATREAARVEAEPDPTSEAAERRDAA
jgi:hypothetical protein